VWERYFHDVAGFERDTIAEAERIGTEEMDVRVTRAAVYRIFELVMLEVSNRLFTIFDPIK
jgi:hypothetical protein